MFIPDYIFDTVYDIPLQLFSENGIKCIFFDIDNTLVPYEDEVPTKENLELFERIKEKGIKIFFVSNNHEKRVKRYAHGLDIPYIYDASKPCVKKYRELANQSRVDIKECAVVGDQIFTDVVAASRLGIKSFLVKPIKDKKSFFFKIKRLGEKPFVAIYNRRNIKK